MFEGTRLTSVIPGYTGHIRTVQRDDPIPIQKQDAKYQIPGYDGYIPSIKSENMFGKTYGKITYTISKGEQIVGQDVGAKQRYSSVTQETYVNQRQVLQRTAAEIVGVPPNQFSYTMTNGLKDSKFWSDSIAKQQAKQLQEDNQVNPQTYSDSVNKFYGEEKNQQIKIGTPLPGYTGTCKRIVAANIFGQTFANARKTALQDQQNIENDKINNFRQSCAAIPSIRK